MKTTFQTDDYVNAHGKNPKGSGNWAFRISGTDGHGSWTTIDRCFFANGTLTAAKRAAKQRGTNEVRSIGRVRELVIEVLG